MQVILCSLAYLGFLNSSSSGKFKFTYKKLIPVLNFMYRKKSQLSFMSFVAVYSFHGLHGHLPLHHDWIFEASEWCVPNRLEGVSSRSSEAFSGLKLSGKSAKGLKIFLGQTVWPPKLQSWMIKSSDLSFTWSAFNSWYLVSRVFNLFPRTVRSLLIFSPAVVKIRWLSQLLV